MVSRMDGMLDSVVALQVAEEATSEETARMAEALRRAVLEWGRIRVLVEVEGFRHMDPDGLQEKLSFVTAHGAAIERMALVCRRVWIKAWHQAGGWVTPIEVRVFDAAQAGDAWQWIRQ